MSDWTSGYVADIGYTYGYYNELNPLRVRLAFLSAGIAYPDVGVACELGYGQGVSANIHAASSGVSWYGTDFNPAQAAFARDTAQAYGAGATLLDQSFAEFCARDDLPEFDFIGVHGIWSWISADNQKVIVDFLRRKLKVGGVLYISYNALPGLASMVPIRHLLTQHVDVMAAPGRGIVSRIDAAMEFANRFLDINPRYRNANPQIVERMKGLLTQNRHYLAHEYFNKDWSPFHFADMAECLSVAKLSFACSSHYLDHVDAINLSPEQQTFLSEIPDPMFRESVRDFVVNQPFRRDYWVKGRRALSSIEQVDALRSQRIMLATPRSRITLRVNGVLGEATLQESLYGPLLDVLADHKPWTVGQLEKTLAPRGISLLPLMQSLLVLAGKGDVVAVQDDGRASKVRHQTAKLNQYLMQKARGGGEISFLASPLTGGGVAVGRFSQLFLAAMTQGRKTPYEWADCVWQLLKAQGQALVKEGRTLVGDAENLAELRTQAVEFGEVYLPALRALNVI